MQLTIPTTIAPSTVDGDGGPTADMDAIPAHLRPFVLRVTPQHPADGDGWIADIDPASAALAETASLAQDVQGIKDRAAAASVSGDAAKVRDAIKGTS